MKTLIFFVITRGQQRFIFDLSPEKPPFPNGVDFVSLVGRYFCCLAVGGQKMAVNAP